jgi:hypothetical protein
MGTAWERDGMCESALTGSNVCGREHNENWCLHSMLTALMQTSEDSTTTLKDDALDIAVILHWMKRACVIFFCKF